MSKLINLDELEKLMTDDAESWGNALNEAGWSFNEHYSCVLGYGITGRLFNSVQTIIRPVIICYIKAVIKHLKEEQKG